MRNVVMLMAIVALLAAAGCKKGQEGPSGATFVLSCPDFEHEGDFPAKFTCDAAGQSVPPSFEWKGVPEGTQSFAFIMEDASGFGAIITQWLVYNIPPEATSLKVGEGKEGQNDLQKMGYSPPCPPAADDAHLLRFQLIALDHMITDAPADFTRSMLDSHLSEDRGAHVLGRADMSADYKRAQ